MKTYDKPTLPISEQIERLIERGMQIPDHARATHYLTQNIQHPHLTRLADGHHQSRPPADWKQCDKLRAICVMECVRVYGFFLWLGSLGKFGINALKSALKVAAG